MESWSADFKENAQYRIAESTRMIGLAFDKLETAVSREELIDFLWKRPNDLSNSLGNLILHLCGNMTQYIISSLGEQPDVRQRDIEFETIDGFTKDELIERLHSTVQQADAIIKEASEAQLLQKREVQGFYFSGMGCVLHAVEHYSYHTGQIAFWIKQLINKDLGFYDGLDLNTNNKNNY